MKSVVRKLIKGIFLNDSAAISNPLTELLQAGQEDVVIMVIREAIISRHLFAGSKSAATISDAIAAAQPKRVMLHRLSEQLNNIGNDSFGVTWVDVVLSADTGMRVQEWTELCEKSKYILAVRRMFKTCPIPDIRYCYTP